MLEIWIADQTVCSYLSNYLADLKDKGRGPVDVAPSTASSPAGSGDSGDPGGRWEEEAVERRRWKGRVGLGVSEG